MTLDTSHYEKGIREAKNSGKAFANQSQGIFEATTKAFSGTLQAAAKVVATAFTGAYTAASAAAGKIVKDAFAAYGELEQNLGGSEAVFLEFAKVIQEKGVSAYKNLGLSMSDYLAYANKIGSLLQGSGFTEGEAAKMAIDVMQRAADVASIMGIDVSSAMDAITGAAKGNFTMMDNLGVAMNDALISDYALNKGIVGTEKAAKGTKKGVQKTTQELSQQQKIMAAFMMFLEQTEKYAGNYAKENDTLSGSMTTLGAAWENFIAGVANADTVSESLNNYLDALLAAADQLLPKLIAGLGVLADSVKERLPELIERFLPVITGAASALFEILPTALSAVVTAAANGLIDIINGVFGANIPHIDTIQFPTWEELKGFAKNRINDVIDGINGLFGLNIPHIDSIKLPSWDVIKETAGPILTAIIDGINAIFNPQEGTGGVVINLVSVLLGAFDDMLTAAGGQEISGKIAAIFTVLGTALSTAAGTITGMGLKILDRVLTFAADSNVSVKYSNFMKNVSYGLLRAVSLVLNLGGQILDQILGYASDEETGTKIQAFMLNVSELLRTSVSTIAGMGLAILGRVLTFVGDPTRAAKFGEFMRNVGTGLAGAVSNIASLAAEVAGQVLTWLGSEDISTTVGNFLSFVGEQLGASVSGIGSLALTIIDTILSIVGGEENASAFSTFMGKVREGLSNAVSNVASAAGGILDAFVTYLGKPEARGKIIRFMQTLARNIGDNIRTVASTAGKIIGGFIDWIGSEEGQTKVAEMMKTIGAGLGTAVGELATVAADIVGKFVDYMINDDGWKKLGKFLATTTMGILQGIDAFSKGVSDAINGIDRQADPLSSLVSYTWGKNGRKGPKGLSVGTTLYENKERFDEFKEAFRDLGILTRTDFSWDEMMNTEMYSDDNARRAFWDSVFTEDFKKYSDLGVANPELSQALVNALDDWSKRRQQEQDESFKNAAGAANSFETIIDNAIAEAQSAAESTENNIDEAVSAVADGTSAAADEAVSNVNAIGNSLEELPDEVHIGVYVDEYGLGSVWDDIMSLPDSYNPISGSHAKGLGYVPYDGYIAELHRGEQVVMANNARDGGGNIDMSALANVIAAAITSAMSDLTLMLDGDVITDKVSQNIAMEARGRRFAT